MNHIKKKDHVYDIVVVGAGLSGLVTAVSLVNKGYDVCVLESTEFPGGPSRLVYSPVGLVNNGLKFFPDSSLAEDVLQRLASLTKEAFQFHSAENGPVTFHNGEIKPFVGFGKEAPSFHQPLSYFLEPKRLEISQSLGHIVADLSAQLGDRFYPGSIVTKYLNEGDEITGVMVNGQKTVFGKNFIHAVSPKYLCQWLSDQNFSSKAKQKIAKAEYWTALGLDVFHRGEVTTSMDLHVLNGTTQDEIGPCVGVFHPAVPSEKAQGEILQHSQWVTFVEDESSEDPEVIGSVLKKIKRQIKRAYPQAMENPFSERILVSPLAEAVLDLKFEKNGSFLGTKNLWLSHGTAGNERNLLGSLQQAFWVSDQFEVACEQEVSEPQPEEFPAFV